MGGIPVEVIYEDDEQKPEVGKQKTDKLLQRDRVDFMAGYIWSNVLPASYKPVVDSKTFLISANAGPSQPAGEQCNPYFFAASWAHEQNPMGDRKSGVLGTGVSVRVDIGGGRYIKKKKKKIIQ